MSLSGQLARGRAKVAQNLAREALPGTITLGGESIRCAIHYETTDVMIGDHGGIAKEGAIAVLIEKTELADRPPDRGEITDQKDQAKYITDSVIDHGAAWQLTAIKR